MVDSVWHEQAASRREITLPSLTSLTSLVTSDRPSFDPALQMINTKPANRNLPRCHILARLGLLRSPHSPRTNSNCTLLSVPFSPFQNGAQRPKNRSQYPNHTLRLLLLETTIPLQQHVQRHSNKTLPPQDD